MKSQFFTDFEIINMLSKIVKTVFKEKSIMLKKCQFFQKDYR